LAPSSSRCVSSLPSSLATMTVIVRNTFLDIAEHKFLQFGEPIRSERRSQSMPRGWKAIATRASPSPATPTIKSVSKMSESSSASTRTGSPESERNFSFFSESDTEADGCVECCSELQSHAELQSSQSEADAGARTKLSSTAASFHSVPATGTSIDAVANAAYLSLVSCSQITKIKVENVQAPQQNKDNKIGNKGKPTTTISAEVSCGPNAAAQSYDAMHLAKQSLTALAAHLPTVALLSARMQKEENGYSMRCSIACLPDGAENGMCWDVMKKGFCPRRTCCKWYHPQDADNQKLKISIKYGIEKVQQGLVAGDKKKLESEVSSGKHQISLDGLV